MDRFCFVVPLRSIFLIIKKIVLSSIDFELVYFDGIRTLDSRISAIWERLYGRYLLELGRKIFDVDYGRPLEQQQHKLGSQCNCTNFF